MKIAIWTYSVAVCIALLAMIALGILFQIFFEELVGNKPLPPLTDFLSISAGGFCLALFQL